MLNRIVLVGRLTSDPEIRYVSDTGTALTKFRIAVDRRFQGQKGEKKTDFIPVVTWGKLAERCKEFLVKGQMVGVDGELQIREWDTPQGEKRRMAEVRADDVRFLSRPAAG
ncbi:MAG: single-stranded DNA-binding protein, partial [bacterium]